MTPFAIRFGIRWTSVRTPSTRVRTESASSCASKWMSRGAVAGRLHDDRVDEPDERGVRDAVVDLEVVLVLRLDLELVDRRLRLQHLRLAGDAGDLG